jgi:hypothetical protein
MNLWHLIDRVEKESSPPVKYGEDSFYPDWDWYSLLTSLCEKKSYLPFNTKREYIDALMLDENLACATADESEYPDLWQAVRDFAAVEPKVEI